MKPLMPCRTLFGIFTSLAILPAAYAASPQAKPNPASLVFSGQPINSVSKAKSITITNSGDAQLNITSITIVGANNASFAQTSNCLSPVAAGASCVINVTFTPSAALGATASIAIADDASGSPQSIPLSGTGTAATLLSISVSAAAASVAAGSTDQLSATATYSDGSAQTPTHIAWTSSDATVATVDATTGVATGIAPGTATISCADQTRPVGMGAVLTVTAAPPSVLQSFTVPPPAAGIAVGSSTVKLAAVGNYTSGAVTSVKDITAGITWSSADPGIASITQNGLITGVQIGTTSITATETNSLPAGVVKAVSVPITVVAPGAGGTAPQFMAQVNAGSRTVTVQGANTDNISIYQFAPTYVAKGNSCTQGDLLGGTLLTISVTGGTATQTAVPLSGNGPNILTLTQPLPARMQLCLMETPNAAGSVPQYSVFTTVNDPNDFGRVRTWFTAGVQISNQQTAATSTTAGEYLDLGFDFSWIRPKKAPGIQTIVSARLSPIPVSATATTTSSTTSTTSTNLNLLTSQQSARVIAALYFPKRTTNWNNGDTFTIAPLARAGFDTLLNPSISSGTANTTTTTMTTGNFSSVYSFWGAGGRIAWDEYPTSSSEAPQMITELDLTLGKYSNLPSFECVSATAGGPVNGANSACGQGTGVLNTLPNVSRTLVPRLEVTGLAKLPGYPIVFGLDANLAQYTLGAPHNIDYLNKPGNDIRIFIGFSFDLPTLVNKLGLPAQ
jgi:hypothetical protein